MNIECTFEKLNHVLIWLHAGCRERSNGRYDWEIRLQIPGRDLWRLFAGSHRIRGHKGPEEFLEPDNSRSGQTVSTLPCNIRLMLIAAEKEGSQLL